MATTTIIILIIAAIIVFWFVNTQRSLVDLDEKCKNAMSQIAVQLNSRWDALLALAQMTAQYAKHESETLIQVIQQRRSQTITTAAEANEQQAQLQDVMSRLLAVREAYPDLKANTMFKETMDGIKQYEENVRMGRMVYNDTATRMNRSVRQWPSSIVASILHFTEKEYLKVDDSKKEQYPDLTSVFGK